MQQVRAVLKVRVTQRTVATQTDPVSKGDEGSIISDSEDVPLTVGNVAEEMQPENIDYVC